MSDTLTEMSKWFAFKHWVDNASVKELREYLDEHSDVKQYYNDEFRYINEVLEKIGLGSDGE